MRIVAGFEAIKGFAVLLVGFGVLAIIDPGMQNLGEQIVHHLHLNPAHHYPRIFIEAMHKVSNPQLLMLAALALAYSSLRLTEAYGLWYGRRWAEWVAVTSGAIYVPLEVYEIVEEVSWISVSTFLVNVGIVAYMSRALWRGRS